MKVILCSGIGEDQTGRTMLHGVVDRLPKDWEIVVLRYKAEYGFVGGPFWGQSFDGSFDDGFVKLIRELDKGPAIVLGFSMGATFAGGVRHRNIIARGLVADPFMPEGVSGNGKFGVKGSRKTYGPVKWVWNRDDIICQADRNSPIRTLADVTASMTFASLDQWAADLASRIAAQRWQAIRKEWWNPIGTAKRYTDAVHGAIGYLRPGGDHVSYGTLRESNGKTGLHNLADWVIQQAS